MSLQRYFYIILFIPLLISAQQSIVKNYTTLDGLPISKLYDCTQAENGNMWFAAEGGLIEYDGTVWTRYDSLNGKSINEPYGYLRVDKENTLWAIPKHMNGRIWFKKNNKWNYLPSVKDSYENYISCDTRTSSDKTQILLVTMLSRIFLISQDSVRQINNSQLDKRKIYYGKFVENAIIFSTDSGLYKYDLSTGKANLIPATDNQIIYSFDYDPSTNTIYYFSSNNIGILKDGSVKKITLDFQNYFNEADFHPSFIKRTPSGDIYFGTVFALYYYNKLTNTIHELNTNNGFTTTGASSVFIDYENNIWFTSYRGINKIKHTPFVSFNSHDLLLENEVTSISNFPNGPFVFAHNTGFTFWTNSQIKQAFDNNLSAAFSRVLNTAYAPDLDIIWFTAQKLGIGSITRKLKINWEILQLDSAQSSYSTLLPAKGNKLFYSTNLGLYSLLGNKSTHLINNPSLNIRRLLNYNDSLIIAATKKGIVLYNKISNDYKIFGTNSNSQSDLYDIYKLKKNKWLAASVTGLLVFDGKSLEDYRELSISQPIFFIRSEDEYLWFGLMGGAIRWNRDTGESIFFDANDGLLGIETNRDAFLYRDSLVYIGTDKGLSIFQSNSYEQDDYLVKPKFHFYGYEDYEGKFYSASKKNIFGSTNNYFTLKYSCPSFIDESATTYTIIINNLDKNVTENFTTSNIDYKIQSLTPASYTIGLFATNINDISSDTLYSKQIIINPPFYLETWFFILMGFLSVSASYSLYDYLNKSRYSKELELKVADRTKQLKESEKNIRQLTQRIFMAQEEQREKIARDLHDNIAQDMAMIKIEIEKLVKDDGQHDIHNNWLINKVSELTKYLRDMSYFLHPNAIKQTGFINAVQSLCNEFVAHSKIEIEFFSNLDESLEFPEEVSTNIYRFIQEALANIKKHSNATSGILILVKRNDSLAIRVEDDGVGFNREEIYKTKSSRSMGLRSMEERILFVGGKLKIKSIPNEGTKLLAEIPLSALSHFNSLTNSDQDSGS